MAQPSFQPSWGPVILRKLLVVSGQRWEWIIEIIEGGDGMNSAEEMWNIRQAVKDKKPLVYSITNNVVTNFTANVLLAAGASPIMSEGQQEAEELAQIADVVVLNIGTLHSRQVEYFFKAGQRATRHGKPVVFDPVGVGATSYRNEVAAGLMTEVKLSLIRGNYGEISFLAGIAGGTKGVDSLNSNVDLEGIKALSLKTGALLAATGKIDFITDGKNIWGNATGHALLQTVTGTGCALTALTGAFLAVAEDRALGVLAALTFYGAAAEKAAAVSAGPGTFAMHFLDALHNINAAEFKSILAKKAAE
jgi:hydroxyethylthiazole kinase